MRVPVEVAQSEANALIRELSVRRDKDAALHDRIASALARASTISEVPASRFGTGLWWVAPTRTDSLRYVSSSLQKLARAVDGADGAPSADARTGVEAIREPARQAVETWQQFRDGELAALIAALEAAGADPLDSVKSP